MPEIYHAKTGKCGAIQRDRHAHGETVAGKRMHHTIRIQRIVLKYHAKTSRSEMHTEMRYANDMVSCIRRPI